MITTLDELVRKTGKGEGITLYKPNRYPLSAGDFFELSRDFESFRDFSFTEFLEEQTAALLAENGEYAGLQGEYRALKKQEESLLPEEAAEIRRKARGLKREIEAVAKNIRAAALTRGTGSNAMPWFLIYKNTLALNDFENLSAFLPPLRDFGGDWIREIPLFTRNAADMRKLSRLAVGGGPCLFGTGEMRVDIRNGGGKDISVDYYTHFYQCRDTASAARLLGASRPDRVFFKAHKPGITPQEYELFDALFQFARCLDVPLLVTLPDMSYIKFFDSITASLDSETRGILRERYTKEVFAISDMYLGFIDDFYRRYRPKNFEVLHERNTALMNLFYKAREPYYLRTKNITTNKFKEAAIYDYISMPAMPFYLWGIPHVLDIDSSDETDSIRKCMRNHSGHLFLHPVLIPEKVSRDGITTIFESTGAFKDYIMREDLAFSSAETGRCKLNV